MTINRLSSEYNFFIVRNIKKTGMFNVESGKKKEICYSNALDIVTFLFRMMKCNSSQEKKNMKQHKVE